ncbi:MAG: hypothetical protein HXY39_02345 [Chloroflexi bacterium]|nr:hypothetical protein [Chloroflexota bacterium]
MQQPTVRDILSVVIGGSLGMLAMLGMSLWLLDVERKAQAQNRPLEDRWIVAASLAGVSVMVSTLSSWAISSGPGTALLAAILVPLAGILAGVAILRKAFAGARRPFFMLAAWLMLGGALAIVLAVQRLMMFLEAQP